MSFVQLLIGIFLLFLFFSLYALNLIWFNKILRHAKRALNQAKAEILTAVETPLIEKSHK